MKPFAYFVATLLGLVSVVLSVTLIVMADINQKAQVRLQVRQQELNSGVLGQQGQQLSSRVLQEMARLAAYDPDMRKLLERHGYQVQAPEDSAASKAITNAPSSKAVTP